MNIEGNFEATLWRHRWRHHHEKYYYVIICDGLFISAVEMKVCLLFQKWPLYIFRSRQTFFIGCYIGSWIYQQGSHYSISDILIDALAQILTDIYIYISKLDLLCDLVTLPMTSWIRIYINVVIISWCLCTGSLMMIYLLVFQLSWKMILFHLWRNIEGRL